MNLIAIFKTNRSSPGAYQVWNDGSIIESFPCLGKADDAMAKQKGNPSRNPERQYGDTPSGIWKVNIGIVMANEDTYGPNKVLVMWPTAGQALKAYNLPGKRNGIWTHGGKPNLAGGLRPTYGCIRLFNKDMARLHEYFAQYGQTQAILETKEE